VFSHFRRCTPLLILCDALSEMRATDIKSS
jgi:hypothetical protein